MTRSRTRRVRKARPCCSAARFQVAFHDKHFHGWTLKLYIYFSVCPDRCLRRGASRTAVRQIIFTPKRATCVVFSLLPSSSGSFSFSASNQPKTAPNSLRLPFRLEPLTTSKSETIQYPPDLSSLYVMAVPCRFLLQRAFSLSAPRFCCWNVLSAPHITTKPPKLRTDRLFFKFLARLRWIPWREKKKSLKKGGQNKRKKKTWPRRENPSKCIHVSCRWKSNPRCQAQLFTAYICVHIHTVIQTYIYKCRFLLNPRWVNRLTGLKLHVHLHSQKVGRGVVVAAHSHREGRSPPGRWSRKVKDRNTQFLEVIIFSLSLLLSLSENSSLHWRERQRF